MTVGDAIDDLLDLYSVIAAYIWRYEHINPQAALWYIRNVDKFHFEDHLRNLQFYLYHKIIEDYYNEGV